MFISHNNSELQVFPKLFSSTACKFSQIQRRNHILVIVLPTCEENVSVLTDEGSREKKKTTNFKSSVNLPVYIKAVSLKYYIFNYFSQGKNCNSLQPTWIQIQMLLMWVSNSHLPIRTVTLQLLQVLNIFIHSPSDKDCYQPRVGFQVSIIFPLEWTK